jgi:hypothetical protein
VVKFLQIKQRNNILIVYKISSEFGPNLPWEDFISENGPSVTITADITHSGEAKIEQDSGDSWFDATVTKLTEDSAKAVLATINNVNVDEIQIVQQGITSNI